ncbi:MAG: prolyl oligopeptidase family serine peptidase [Candidatus Promineifilaceae bacterium]
MPKDVVPGLQIGQSIDVMTRLGYLFYLPRSYGQDPDKKWPLILFLHGMGERGDDLDLLRLYGPAKVAEKQPDLPFICLTPQCPEGDTWIGQLKILNSLLDEELSSYSVDLDRVYLTGFSMGGYGTWGLAMAYPQSFAAIAPICGGGMVQWVEILKDIPVWAFHGADDPTVPVEESQRMVDALRSAGGQAKFTVYPGVGHDSWTETYDNPELYEWFLRHRRKSPHRR